MYKRINDISNIIILKIYWINKMEIYISNIFWLFFIKENYDLKILINNIIITQPFLICCIFHRDLYKMILIMYDEYSVFYNIILNLNIKYYIIMSNKYEIIIQSKDYSENKHFINNINLFIFTMQQIKNNIKIIVELNKEIQIKIIEEEIDYKNIIEKILKNIIKDNTKLTKIYFNYISNQNTDIINYLYFIDKII